MEMNPRGLEGGEHIRQEYVAESVSGKTAETGTKLIYHALFSYREIPMHRDQQELSPFQLVYGQDIYLIFSRCATRKMNIPVKGG